MNRAQKIALLTQIVEGRITKKQVIDLRKSQEPLFITLKLGDDDSLSEPNDPTYCIDISDDWKQSRCYWQYADGQVEEISRKP